MNEKLSAFVYFYYTFKLLSRWKFSPKAEKNQDELIIRNSKKSDLNSSEDRKKEKEWKIEKFGALDLDHSLSLFLSLSLYI